MRTRLACLLVIALSVTSCFTPFDPQDTLIAVYRFSGNARDLSGNMYHATLSGGTFVADRSGSAGDALLLDGVDDSAETPIVSLPDLTGLTVAVWFRTSSAEPLALVSKFRHSSGSETDDSFFVGIDAGEVRFQVNAGDSSGYLEAAVNVADDEWHHVASTWDGLDQVIYIDGVERARAAYSGSSTINNTALPLVIGVTVNDGGGPRYFDGSIDDVYIYSSALATAQVQELFQAE